MHTGPGVCACGIMVAPRTTAGRWRSVEVRWRPLAALLSCACGLALAWGLILLFQFARFPVQRSREGTGTAGSTTTLVALGVAAVAAAAAGPVIGWLMLRDRRWLAAAGGLAVATAAFVVLLTVRY